MTKFIFSLFCLTVLGCSTPQTSNLTTANPEIQTRADKRLQHDILNEVKKFHKINFPDFIDLTPVAARAAGGVKGDGIWSKGSDIFEVWQFKCKDRLFTHLIRIYSKYEMVENIVVIKNDKFPKIHPA